MRFPPNQDNLSYKYKYNSQKHEINIITMLLPNLEVPFNFPSCSTEFFFYSKVIFSLNSEFISTFN